MYKYFCAAVALSTAFVATQASAVAFDSSTGTTATAVVDAAGGGDYTSLKAASQAFNSVSTINRPWLLLINSDLVEPARIAFGTNVASGASLTIKPAPTKTPTITLSNVAPYTNSYYGAIVIGCNDSGITDASAGADPTASSIFETNNAFIIDGSNTTGGTSRDLTFKIDATGDVTGYIFRVVGTTNGFVLQNCTLLNLRSSSTANIIGFGAGNIAGFGTQGGDYKSDNAIIQNNFMQVNSTSSASSGIGINYSIGAFGTLTSPKNYENHIIRNNVIFAKHRCVSALYMVNSEVTGNEMHVANNGSGYHSGAVQHILNNGTFPTAYTMLIANNKILDAATSNTAAGANLGVSGITLAGGNNANYKVYNNVITGVLSNGATASDSVVCGIFCNSTLSKFDVEHNSVNVGPSPIVSGATSGRMAGIYINNGTNATANSIKNNIVRYNASKGAPLFASATGTSGVAIDPANVAGNNFFQADTGNPLAYIGTAVASITSYADQAALAAANYNLAGGQSVDPAATTPAWSSDLSFSAAPSGLGTVSSSNILFDINMQARPATNAYPGAYAIAGSSVHDWAVY